MIKKLISLIIHLSITNLIYSSDGSLDTTFGTNGNGTVITPPSTFSAVLGVKIFSIALQSTGKIVAGGTGEFGGDTHAVLARYNTNGTLDTSFGTNGTTNISGVTSVVKDDIAIQTDDKIVVGIRGSIVTPKFIVARLTSNGSLDSSFGSGGITSLTIGTTSFINSVKIQSDGKIIAGGRATVTGVSQFAVARFNTDGTPDSSFGSAGATTLQIGTFSQINSIAIQSNGKIIAAGQATISGVPQFAVARFNSDGSLDTSFGSSGVVTIPIGNFSSVNSVAIQANGMIVLGGTSITTMNQFTLARLQTNGSLDTTFGTNGIVIVPSDAFGAGTTGSVIESIALQIDGKIVAGGVAAPGGVNTFAVARFLTNGSLDSTFGQGGIVTVLPLTLFGPNPLDAQANSILIQSNGKIVAGGFFDDTSFEYFALARFNSSIGCLTNLTQAISGKYGI